VRGEAFARQLELLALLEARPEGVEPEEVAGELGALRRIVYRDFRVLETLIQSRDVSVPRLRYEAGRTIRDSPRRWLRIGRQSRLGGPVSGPGVFARSRIRPVCDREWWTERTTSP
jgi:hypothetical protein